MTAAASSLDTPMRAAAVTIDLTRLAANLARLRVSTGEGRRIYAVIKGDSYGAGIVQSAQALQAAGVDALAVGNADDVVMLRAAGITCDILAYGSTPPVMAAHLIELDAILTIHDLASLHAILAAAKAAKAAKPPRVFVKVDCGLARLGIALSDAEEVFSTLAATDSVTVEGIYTHLAGQHDPVRVRVQADRLAQAVAVAKTHGIAPQIIMLASSWLILKHPDLNLTAVDPGRIVFGLARDEWGVGGEYEAVIARFSGRLIQVSTLPAGTIPYGSNEPIASELRVGVIAAGTTDGLVFTRPGQPVLVRGKRAAQLGASGIEHSLVDLSAVPDANVGDEVVWFGRDGDEEITPLEFSRYCDRPIDQCIPLVGRLARRNYVSS
ncbi:MAG TPA: alanine racemase [Rhizobiaceae bacterium]|nr:alanine racemase [Rhizobiaceae bacterium]